MTDEYNRLIEQYVADFEKELRPYYAQLSQIRESNSERRLRTYEASLQRRKAEVQQRVMQLFRVALEEASRKRHAKVAVEAAREAIRRGYFEHTDDVRALPFDTSDEGLSIVWYWKRLGPILEKIQSQPRNRKRDLLSEASKLERLQDWRKADPDMARFLAGYLRERASELGASRRGRKKNETALSDERRIVNKHLPGIRAAKRDYSLRWARRNEVAMLCDIASAMGIKVDRERMGTAIENWNRTNPSAS